MARGKLTRDASGRKSVVYDESPEADAFTRWQDHKFEEVERAFASSWRASLSAVDNGSLAAIARHMFSISDNPKNLADAYLIADSAVRLAENGERNLVLGCRILGLSETVLDTAMSSWSAQGRPALELAFPYFVHCLTVELFFHIAVHKTLISPDRASNKIDVTYLFYLPFCSVFVSNDKLHKRSAPLFMTEGQSLVGGDELKADLQAICSHYSAYNDDVEKEGIFRLANRPPLGADSLSTKLWNGTASGNHTRQSPASGSNEKPSNGLRSEARERTALGQEFTAELRERINSMRTGVPLVPGPELRMDQIEQVAIERKIPLRRGRWRLLPKGIENEQG